MKSSISNNEEERRLYVRFDDQFSGEVRDLRRTATESEEEHEARIETAYDNIDCKVYFDLSGLSGTSIVSRFGSDIETQLREIILNFLWVCVEVTLNIQSNLEDTVSIPNTDVFRVQVLETISENIASSMVETMPVSVSYTHLTLPTNREV